MSAQSKEAVGPIYNIDAMRRAQANTWKAIETLSALIKPGMHETEAVALGKQVLADLDMQRIWHPLLVRFGANTLKTFKQRSDGDLVLGENDIFFIDMGAVWEGHEGDAGETFVTGNDPEMKACAEAAKTLFERVQAKWKNEQVAGLELYRYAQEQAKDMGWVLNLDIKGHRVSDFPHAIHRGGDLGDFDHYPNKGLWILEIQIAHPSKAYGAFYEDLLA
ncbi:MULTISPECIES: M24 family metallopeptidase [unclassified Pseudomonas]|uniref:M24 family metallopeptidase n=1 Tax=unclassified Pseudomonas TaxID=196821 RepID=UPI0013265185|nr:M24 family metallopeptidase [Pseudomonas sp. FSL R10-0765]MQT52846.1 M24 family metallopeptidase [Pseudomonas sp. FSL R10-2398]MQU01120.1 M24 family metallopeptidase [Pseudomonas sp. FSL R10-2245]MQU11070.1 M24 family metallopeptidase [Pseudomonas sp. FSL R10-2189]MQU37894.1 M24 family metallopeptidase [Pseudomonas sp. FSL R10-2172]